MSSADIAAARHYKRREEAPAYVPRITESACMRGVSCRRTCGCCQHSPIAHTPHAPAAAVPCSTYVQARHTHLAGPSSASTAAFPAHPPNAYAVPRHPRLNITTHQPMMRTLKYITQMDRMAASADSAFVTKPKTAAVATTIPPAMTSFFRVNIPCTAGPDLAAMPGLPGAARALLVCGTDARALITADDDVDGVGLLLMTPPPLQRRRGRGARSTAAQVVAGVPAHGNCGQPSSRRPRSNVCPACGRRSRPGGGEWVSRRRQLGPIVVQVGEPEGCL